MSKTELPPISCTSTMLVRTRSGMSTCRRSSAHAVADQHRGSMQEVERVQN